MLVVPARAKVNLALEVVRRREDGFHDIESVVVPIDWHDLIGVDAGDHPSEPRVTGPSSRGVPGGAAAPAAADNLAVRAADALLAAATAPQQRVRPASLSVWVHKRVPAGAGLGGGSADAAATLRAGVHELNERGVHVRVEDVEAVAAALGSDVPALLARTAVHVTGRGERLVAIAAPALHLVVVFLGPSSTRDAYGALRPEELSDGHRVRSLIEALQDGSRDAGDGRAGVSPLADDMLGSALEAPALRLSEPLLAAAKNLRDSTAPVRWHMTGSGGAFFAMTPDAASSAALALRLRTGGLLARACRTLPPSPVRP